MYTLSYLISHVHHQALIKSYALTLALPIVSILNASIQQSLVPITWKKAEVIPIQKTHILTDITKELRPISLTPTLGKICKRFVSDWVIIIIKGLLNNTFLHQKVNCNMITEYSINRYRT